MGSKNRANGEAEVSDAMRHAATRLSDDLARTARDAREAADELGAALRHSAVDLADDVQARATEATRGITRGVQRGVRRHPIAWLSAAAGTGAVLTLLVTSRSR